MTAHRVMAYFFGAFVALLAGVAAFGFTGVFGAGVVGAVVVFLVAASIIRGWRDPLREADEVRARGDTAAYSQAVHGEGYSDGGGSGGGCDGGGGGSC